MSDAGPGKDDFGHNGAFQQIAIGDGENGDQLHRDIRQYMAGYGARRADAFRTRRNHVILAKLFEGEGAGHAGNVGHCHIGKDDRRQHDMRERIPENLCLTC
ncbi:hypothetical protein D3C71_1447350 [compost metagenome]